MLLQEGATFVKRPPRQARGPRGYRGRRRVCNIIFLLETTAKCQVER
jgi:hypothetical protein